MSAVACFYLVADACLPELVTAETPAPLGWFRSARDTFPEVLRGAGRKLEACNDLRPDRNHPQKQRKRGECGSFDGNSADHGHTLLDENKTRT